ncbi:transcription factor HIVEP3 isoform X2 [Wyeomyia smithii]|uniref:transcription factor HIVEP3 isoform X2 n=1 Tax=Wyeomyia smithii TaxID=174621 RepID=UPI002467B831|nr:transcription factor HIVEP3 isoform X2 [Wyeomyia smithii]
MDDPGGELPPAMEITNSCNESKTTSVSQPYSSSKQPIANPAAESKVSAENSILHHSQTPPTPSRPQAATFSVCPSPNATNSSDLKYLHKKFKRIASATLSNNNNNINNDSGSESKLVTSAAAATSSSSSSSSIRSSSSSSSGGDSSTNIVTTTAALPAGTSIVVVAVEKQQASAYGSPAVRLPNSLSYESVQRLHQHQHQQQQQQQQNQHTIACANEGDLVDSYRPATTERIIRTGGQPTVGSECHSRPQLTSLSSEHSNGASLNRTNNISGVSNSFISSSSSSSSSNHNHIPRESEDLKTYYPSVNNNSAINNINCDLNEKNQCPSILNNSNPSGGGGGSVVTLSADSIQAIQQAAQYETAVNHGPPAGIVVNFGCDPASTAPLHSPLTSANLINTAAATPGRYVCPFCQMNCSKPSVLQKHIRRHTNERPFRCDPCGIAFKTKSNLYKHCRSRAHASKSQGEDIGAVIDEDGGSLGGSDIEDKELSNSGSEIINRGSPMDDRVHSPQLLVEKPYKPKFHNAALYAKLDAKLANKFPSSGPNSTGSGLPPALNVSHSAPPTPHYFNGQNVESLEQHISKLISDNEAIVEVVEPPLQKKYHKITGITRGISVGSSSSHSGPHESGTSSSSSGSSSSKLASALLQKRNSEEQLLYLPQQGPQQPYVNPFPSEPNVITVSNSKPNVSSKPAVVQYGPNHHAVSVQMAIRLPSEQHDQLSAQQVQYQQPLNLSKPMPSMGLEPLEQIEQPRKRSSGSLYSREQSPSSSLQYPPSQTASIHTQPAILQQTPPTPPQTQPVSQQQQQQQQPMTVSDHPQNPERSIIKDLLLNSRGFGVVQNPENENIEKLFTCKSCNVSFRDAEILKYHMICYCQGSSSNLNSPSSSAPISPVGSPSQFNRSKSYNPNSLKTLARVSLNPPPRNPSTLSKLAKSQLRLPRIRPENISLLSALAKENLALNSMGSSANSHPSEMQVSPAMAKIVDVVQNPLPSPGPLLGNTRLVDFQSNKAMSAEDASVTQKRALVITVDEHQQTLRRVHQYPNLQLFGGNVEIVDRNCLNISPHRYTSGGTVTRCSPEIESGMQEYSGRVNSMHSGGTFTQLPENNRSTSPAPMNPDTPKLVVTITPTLTPALATPSYYGNQQQVSEGNNSAVSVAQPVTHFHFPPINPITAYNPLTLPQVSPGQAQQIMHGGKLIPFVQGIPGPNSMLIPNDHNPQPKSSPRMIVNQSTHPLMQSISISTGNHQLPGPTVKLQSSSLLTIVKPTNTTAIDRRNEIDEDLGRSKKPFLQVAPGKNGLSKEIWSPAKQEYPVPKKSFNFSRMADNISPRKKELIEQPPIKKEEIRYFNFENLISKSEILIKTTATAVGPLECKAEPMEVKLEPPPSTIVTKPKFLRPNSLPLKPGTFTPKRHHGITPTHNTMPLISPETPRPSKSCRELYFNGHAYTNIGLKSSTKPFYCTVNKTQPFYVQTQQKQLSMYSNWQVHPENDPHPLGLKPVAVMSLYDSSQQRNHRYSIAQSHVPPLSVVNSSSFNNAVMSTVEVKTNFPAYSLQPMTSPKPTLVPLASGQHQQVQQQQTQSTQSYLQFGYHDKGASNDSVPARSESSERTLSGGFESTEEYTYVRGRGRGKYVCKECGIRCKKPSMLKKHIRTHTDVRPYSCQYCSFHFKTKGNLTKHMKSKSHYKKCSELGLNPIPTGVDDDGGDVDIEGDQQSISSERTSTIPGDSDSGSESDGEDSDDSDESKSRLPEHEAAHCLLSLSMTPPTSSQISKSYPSPVPYSSQQLVERDRNRHQGYPLNDAVSPGGLIIYPQQSPAALVDQSTSQPNRRIITFGNTPKVEFNLLKHEQYYSDPNLSKKKRDMAGTANQAVSFQNEDDDDGAMPIDLTKKVKEVPTALQSHSIQEATGYSHHSHYQHQNHHQLSKGSNVLLRAQHHPEQLPNAISQVIVRMSDVVTPITGTANLLTTLVSNTDKIPLTHGLIPGSGKELVDDNVYFQEYIKQRALQDSRMKQSQMKSVTNSSQYEDSQETAGAVDSQMPLVKSQKLEAPLAITTATTLVVNGPVNKGVVPPVEKVYRIFNGKNELHAKVANTDLVSRVDVPVVGNESIPQESDHPITEVGEAVVNTAVGSGKLDLLVEPIRSRSNSVKSNDSTKPSIATTAAATAAAGSGKESAKSVASEYLKLTKSVTLRKREDSESGTASDQEPPVVENKIIPTPPIVAPIVPPIVVVPPTSAATGELGGIVARTVVVGEDGFKSTPATNEFASLSHFQEDGGRPVCEVCNKRFLKMSQLKIHMNIHYMERKYRCEPCGTSFRSQGLFLKHERSATHRNKVSMTTTFGIATDSNPRPFYCKDCDVGFRIHGHLAKHLRSKMHVLKLECLGKLPFGTYTEIERSGTNLTEIDTTDCENSLSSLKRLAIRLHVKDPANVLPGGGSGGLGPSGSGNETDSCDDNQYENDNDESNVEDSSSSNGPTNNRDDETDNDGEPSSAGECNGPLIQPINNNNNLSMKRKPDDSSTSGNFEPSEAKRARMQPATAAIDVNPGGQTTSLPLPGCDS